MRPAVIDDPLVLDANAVAGDLREIMGVEVTTYVARCAHCGNRAALGTLRAWAHGPGVVLRCARCAEVAVVVGVLDTRLVVEWRGVFEVAR